MAMIGRQRSNAVWRVLALVAYALIGWIISVVAFAAAFVFMVIDVIWQLITNSSGFSKSGTAGMWLVRLYEWQIDIFGYIFIGDPMSFPWRP